MWRILLQQNPSLGAFQSRFNPQSAWALRWAVMAAMLVIILPAIVLVLAAILIGTCVFFILSLVAKAMAYFGAGPNDSKPTSEEVGLRQNVRVMEEDSL